MVLNFITPRYVLLFLNFEIYIAYVINCEWSKFVNFSLRMFCMQYKLCFFQQEGYSALLECRSAHSKCWLAQTFGLAREPSNWDKAYLFRLFRDMDMFQFISKRILTSRDRGNKSELRALLFWLFNSLYVKNVLEAFALGTSFSLVKFFRP